MKINDETANNNPFRVPEEYFDTLANRTMAAIREEKENGRQEGTLASVPPVVQRGDAGHGKQGRFVHFRPFLALAAAILGFAILATAVVKLVTSDRQGRGAEPGSILYADMAAEEIDTYMLENELNMTENVSGEMPEETISPEAIIDYLMTEDIDLDEIYELF